MFRFCFVLLWCLATFYARAQTVPARQFTVEDGLPSNTVYCLYSDSKGYLWIGTDKGIAKYNGLKFITYTTSDGLPDNEVFNIAEDPEGRLWICSFRGSLCYYKDDTFHTVNNTPWLKLPVEYVNYISRPLIGKDSSLLFSSNDGNTFARLKGNSSRIYAIESLKRSVPGKLSNQMVRQIEGNQFQVFYATRSVIIDSNANFIRNIPYHDSGVNTYGLSHNSEYLFSKTSVRDLDDKKVAPCDKLPYDSLNHTIYFNRDKSTFITFKNGLLYNNHTILLKGQNLNTVEGDISDNVWTGSKKNGIFNISRYIDHLTFYPEAYKGNVLLARTIDKTLFFITSNGDYYKLDDKKISLIYRANLPESYGNLLKVNFFISKEAEYFFLYKWANFFLTGAMNKNTVPLKKQAFRKDQLSKTTKEIFEIGNDFFIFSISTLSKLNHKALSRGENSETELISAQNDNDLRIFSRALDPSDSSIWFSRVDGVFKMAHDIPSRQPQFKNQAFRQFTFSGGYLTGITPTNELLIYSHYQQHIGIDSIKQPDCIWENIYNIDDHRMLISTNNYYRLLTLLPASSDGKARYTLQTIEDPVVPLRADCITVNKDHCSFFKNGAITVIETGVLFERPNPPVPLFTSFKTKAKPYNIRPEINISYAESKNINIGFDNISFVGASVICEYTISDDQKEEWREISGNEINLNTPGYGTFTVKIRSRTLSSGFSKPAVLVIHIGKPFWAAWWFIAISALFLLGLIWVIIIGITWRKLRKRQKEHDADMKYQQSEYKALNALMNPHFIFNSLNNIQGLINKDDKLTANQYLVIFSDLVRQNMHNVSKGFISLQEELTLIENYLTLEKLRFKDLVNYEINVEEDVDLDDIMIPPLMIQPLVENAVKHGLLPMQSTLSKVTIQVYEQEDKLCIIIEDNGIGLTQSLASQNKLHESFGLSNLKKRTEHLRKIQHQEVSIEVSEIKDNQGNVSGTRAVVTMQLN